MATSVCNEWTIASRFSKRGNRVTCRGVQGLNKPAASFVSGPGGDDNLKKGGGGAVCEESEGY